MKKNADFRKWMKQIAIFLGIGVAYLIFVRVTGRGIPCIFYLITGFQCPGCGITRAIVELSRGNFEKALQYNALCLSVYPAIVLYLLYRSYRKVKYGRSDYAIWEYAGLVLLCVIIVMYFILRNRAKIIRLI